MQLNKEADERGKREQNSFTKSQTRPPMKVIEALKQAIEIRLRIETVMEPSNAVARKEVRVMLTGPKTLSRLATDNESPFIPYEAILNIIISVRISGGNTQNFINSQAIRMEIALAEYLEHDLIVLTDIGETLINARQGDAKSSDDALKIVGDAELSDPVFQNSAWSGDKSGEDYDKRDDLFVYRIDWTAKLILTVHRYFFNPALDQITSLNETSGEEEIICHDE